MTNKRNSNQFKKANEVTLLKLPHDAVGTFVERPNRFLGIVDIKSPKKYQANSVEIHVHDPGRLKELLYSGNKVLLKKVDSENRRTKWDLIAAEFDNNWVLVHSGYHRLITESIISNDAISPFCKIHSFKAEQRFETSRFDFLIKHLNGRLTWVEVKGCTLAIDKIALFPDAPTLRGARHLEELIKAKRQGNGASVIILVFRTDAKCFSPHFETDPKFAQVFFEALDAGVKVYPLVLTYKNGFINYSRTILICKQNK